MKKLIESVIKGTIIGLVGVAMISILFEFFGVSLSSEAGVGSIIVLVLYNIIKEFKNN